MHREIEKKRIRLDKWLWAARFFKTRNLAKNAVEGGRVKIEGRRLRASYQVKVGDLLKIPQGWEDREITVLALSKQRRRATEAKLLYRETDESVSTRNERLIARKLAGEISTNLKEKPDKKTRRQIRSFKKNLY